MRCPSTRREQRSATTAVTALLAIPFLSVTIAAGLGDVTSSTDASRLGPGLLALTVGTLAGLGSVSLARLATGGLVIAATLLASDRGPARALGPTRHLIATAPALVPVTSGGHSPLRRRGPPLFSTP